MEKQITEQQFDEMAERILAIAREGDAKLADAYTKLQLSRSAIQTTIRTLEDLPYFARPDWLIGYLLGILQVLK